MRRLVLIATALLLWACQPQTPEGDAATAPADAPEAQAPDGGAPTVLPPANDVDTPAEPKDSPVAHGPADDFRSEMRLTGTEPFWGVNITSGQIKLMRPDHADVVVTNAGPTINGDVAVWNARDLTIRLEHQPGCSDGMSDNRYPYAATVTVKGEVLKGCAARADQWPRGGG